MTQTIKLTLVKSLIFESVKNETYYKGQFDKALDGKAITVAYHEQAGNETYQERLLNRALYTNLEELKTHLSDYIAQSVDSTGDNTIDSEEEDDNIIISLVVSDRFNKGYTNSLAKLCSKYVEESMLMDWWKPVNEKQSALYAQFVERDLAAIKRCFNKTAPVVPTNPYTTTLSTEGSAIEIAPGEEGTVTYTISEGAIDDIEATISDTSIATIGRSTDGFTVTGVLTGHATMTMYSRHNDTLIISLDVYCRNS